MALPNLLPTSSANPIKSEQQTSEQQATAEFGDCKSVNPGCFAVDGSFAVYRPAAKAVEASVVS